MTEIDWPEINQEDALKLIERLSEWTHEAVHALLHDGLNEFHSHELDGVRQHIALFTPEPDQWQPVSEYKEGLALVCREGEDWVRIGYRYSEHGAVGWLTERHMALPATPTHFQPLPKAKR